MANRRQLKKALKSATGELFADCVALSMCQQGNAETLDAIMADIIALHLEYVTRVSHTEKGSERKFYKELRREFTEKANELSERIVKA